MQSYDIAIIGLGPAGATLARLLSPSLNVVALDKKQEQGEGGFQKPCGGLLAPDAQRSLRRMKLTLPARVLVSPQLSHVETLDLQSGVVCRYGRNYINISRHAFDLWLKSLIPRTVKVFHNARCKRIEKNSGNYRITFDDDNGENVLTARYVVGADGASSLVRRLIYPNHSIRHYQALQQWFTEQNPTPFHACLFDNALMDNYAWCVAKGDYFIIGGAFPMKEGKARFAVMKDKLAQRGIRFGEAVKSEKCLVLCPEKWSDFVCGEHNAFLIGEAAGFISASSLEGISYALDSAEKLSRILNAGAANPNAAYWKSTRGLRARLFGKIIKGRVLTSSRWRNLIMRSRIAALPDQNV